MKTPRKPARPTPSARAPDRRAARPMMQELYRRATAQVRKQRKNHRMQPAVAKSEPGTQKLLHELQVHQVELEMQNAELHDARNRAEVLLEKYTDLYDFAPVGHFSIDESGLIIEVNLMGAAMLGLERSRVLNRSLPHFATATSQPVLRTFLRRVFAGNGKESCEAALIKEGTAVMWASFRGTLAVSISAPRRWCRVAVSDITALKVAEDRVRISEIRYRRLFEAAQNGVLLLDPGTRKITDANPFMTQLLGSRREQLVGKELFEIGLLKDETASRNMFQQLRRNHKVRYENLPLRIHGGPPQEVEVVASLYQENGRPVIQCNLRDITERNKTEEIQRRLEVLAASNSKLEKEIVRRRTAEISLTKSERHQRGLLEESRRMQTQLQRLSHQVLHAQEEERKRISRDLHDEIVQTLVGINVRLVALATETAGNTGRLRQKLKRTQRLVEESVETVHRFARELRPTALDDLGLIPALHSFVEEFTRRTGLRAHLIASAKVERLDIDNRTVLYRVALEALNNVARHARASRVDLEIASRPDRICMKIRDDGKSFDADRALHPRGRGRLGLVGMKERLEMVGGNLSVESAPGLGTTIKAEIPLDKDRSRGGRHRPRLVRRR